MSMLAFNTCLFFVSHWCIFFYFPLKRQQCYHHVFLICCVTTDMLLMVVLLWWNFVFMLYDVYPGFCVCDVPNSGVERLLSHLWSICLYWHFLKFFSIITNILSASTATEYASDFCHIASLNIFTFYHLTLFKLHMILYELVVKK